mmetsp:Transcript_19308/g.74034  ORF Transcript_19308/g.74034 Transcript_19308/m.74034 type:complete len:240 (-) Transcript_19308:2179-2898(-)
MVLARDLALSIAAALRAAARACAASGAAGAAADAAAAPAAAEEDDEDDEEPASAAAADEDDDEPAADDEADEDEEEDEEAGALFPGAAPSAASPSPLAPLRECLPADFAAFSALALALNASISSSAAMSSSVEMRPCWCSVRLRASAPSSRASSSWRAPSSVTVTVPRAEKPLRRMRAVPAFTAASCSSAMAASSAGTSCPASRRALRMSCAYWASSAVMNVKAVPLRSARPVRPTRWM